MEHNKKKVGHGEDVQFSAYKGQLNSGPGMPGGCCYSTSPGKCYICKEVVGTRDHGQWFVLKPKPRILFDTEFALYCIPIVFNNLPIEVSPFLHPIYPFHVKVDDDDRVRRINRRSPRYIRAMNPEYHGAILERCRKQVCHEVSIDVLRAGLGMVQCTINRVVGRDKILQRPKRGVPPNGS